MKRIGILAVLAAAALPGLASAEVGVNLSVAVGQPGFYGVIDIGNAPPPLLYNPQPLLIAPVAPGYVMPPPLYLRVPPGHRKHWDRYCMQYGACGRPVYFVQDGWYNNVYAPHYERHRDYYEGRRGYEEQHPWGPPGDRGRGEGRGHEGRGGPEGHGPGGRGPEGRGPEGR